MKEKAEFLYLLVTISAMTFALIISGCTGSTHDAPTEMVDWHDDHEGHTDCEDDSHDDEAGVHLSRESLEEAAIEVETLKPRILSSWFDIPGTVIPHPDDEAFVGCQIDGRIREILVDIGDHVNKGDPLCIIESPVIGEAEATYITAKAELEFVRSDYARHKTLVSEGIGSRKELHELEARLKANFSSVSAAEKTLHAYGFNEEDIRKLDTVNHTGGRVTLRSPLPGNVIDRNVRRGIQVTPEIDLFHIVNLQRLRIHVEIPERRLGDVKEGAQVQIISQNRSESGVSGFIGRLGDKINEETRSLTGYITVDNQDLILCPGAFTTVQIAIDNGNAPVLAVPIEAIIMDEHGDEAVFIEKETGLFILREIETGYSVGGWTEITAGITLGERVVTRGAFTIKSEAEKSAFGHGHAH